MGLSPDDIVNYPLKQSVRGYSVAQVDGLLDQLADTVEGLESERDDLRARLDSCEQRLSGTSETEATLKRTLVTAQRAAEQSLDEARQRSSDLIEEAQTESEAMLERARAEADQLRSETLRAAQAEEAEVRRRRQALEGHVEALRIFEQDYHGRLRGQLEDQLRILDEVQNRPLPMSSGAEVVELPATDEDAPAPHEPPLTVRVREESADSDVERHDPDGEVGSGSSRDGSGE